MESKQLKVVIVGHSGVGKTSLIGRYIFDNFDAGSEATLGAVFHEKQHVLPDKSTVGLEIWDTAGQERYRSIAKIYYKDAKVVLAVYDVTSERSFNELKLWVDEVRSNSSKSTRLIVVGNKIDLLSEELNQNRGEATYEVVKQYCGEIGAELKLTSAKDSRGVQELFDSVAKKGGEAVMEMKAEQNQQRMQLK